MYQRVLAFSPLIAATIALALGLARLGQKPLWSDEVATASAVSRNTPAFIRLLSHVDVSMGGYYALLRGWSALAGHSDTALRLPSAMGVAAAAGLAAVIGRKLGGDWAGLVAGILAATQPTLQSAAQLARPYGLMSAAVAGVVLLAIQLDARETRGRALAFGALAIASCYVHLYSLLVVTVCLGWLWLQRNRYRGRISVAVALFVLPQLILAGRERGAVSWLPPVSSESVKALAVALAGHRLLVPVLVAIAAGALWTLRSGSSAAKLVVAAALIPGPFLIAVSLAHHLFYPRYLIDLTPLASVVAALGIASLWRYASTIWRGVLALSTVAAVATGGLLVGLQDARTYQYENARALERVVDSRSTPADDIVYSNGALRAEMTRYRQVAASRSPQDVLEHLGPDRTDDYYGSDYAPSAKVLQLEDAPAIWLVSYQTAQGSGAPDEAAEVRSLIKGDRVSEEWRYGRITLELLRAR